jgi:hypothetical protein
MFAFLVFRAFECSLNLCSCLDPIVTLKQIATGFTQLLPLESWRRHQLKKKLLATFIEISEEAHAMLLSSNLSASAVTASLGLLLPSLAELLRPNFAVCDLSSAFGKSFGTSTDLGTGFTFLAAPPSTRNDIKRAESLWFYLVVFELVIDVTQEGQPSERTAHPTSRMPWSNVWAEALQHLATTSPVLVPSASSSESRVAPRRRGTFRRSTTSTDMRLSSQSPSRASAATTAATAPAAAAATSMPESAWMLEKEVRWGARQGLPAALTAVRDFDVCV